jgi:ABC-type multidrug transport system ATPase subunit
VERVRIVVELLGLGRHRGDLAEVLSSGLRKRLGIGIGIVRDADVFLFDEPFASLDVEAMSILGRILMTLKKKGRTVIVASHAFPVLSNLYDRVWALSGGKIADQPVDLLLASSPADWLWSGDRQAKEVRIPWIRRSR